MIDEEQAIPLKERAELSQHELLTLMFQLLANDIIVDVEDKERHLTVTRESSLH
jgi:hypothetical protein